MNAESPRLLQAMAGARHGGAEIFFVRLVLALQRGGQDQHALIRRDAERSALLRAEGVAVGELPFGRWFDVITKFGFRRAIRAYNPRIVLTWMSRATELCPPSKGNFVHVARLGGYYNLDYYRRCDHLIGNTRDIVDYVVREGWPPAHAHYVPNFVPAMIAPRVSRASLDTPKDVPLALALGRLHPNKGFDVLLDALAVAPGIYLWLAGEGPLRAELETRAARLGIAHRIRFLGWRADTAALLAAADMLVCPSRSEPLGNVVIEAWSAGVPVVASNSAGPSALIRNGETGLLVPVEDKTALGQAMTRLIDELALRQRLVVGGRAAYEVGFSEAVVVAQYRSLIDRLAR